MFPLHVRTKHVAKPLVFPRLWMLQKRKLLPPRELLNHAVQRENRLCHRRERERACRVSENPEQREERLQKRRIRDRTRHAAQTAERRGADLQQRRRRLAVETDELR